VKIVQVALRPNHSQTDDLGFKDQPRNMRSSSPRARCRPHMVPPDLSIVRPPSTLPMRPSPVLCTRSPTPAMVLVTARHVTPATCTPRDKQTQFSKQNKCKRKTKQNYPRFEFKPRQVNDSSQSNQGTNHLVSHLLMKKFEDLGLDHLKMVDSRMTCEECGETCHMGINCPTTCQDMNFVGNFNGFRPNQGFNSG
jgi:hypothetical protein